MEIREYKRYNEEQILNLYASVGWTAYTACPETLREGFANSMLVLAAYEGETLVGIVRAVGDGHTIVFVQDILGITGQFNVCGLASKFFARQGRKPQEYFVYFKVF